MQPEEYKHLKAFRDIIQKTLTAFRGATSQAGLSSAVAEYEPIWKDVDDEFAEVLRGVKSKVWSMPLPQVRQVVTALCGHLESTMAGVDQQLKG